jgi:hypothetical protein
MMKSPALVPVIVGREKMRGIGPVLVRVRTWFAEVVPIV